MWTHALEKLYQRRAEYRKLFISHTLLAFYTCLIAQSSLSVHKSSIMRFSGKRNMLRPDASVGKKMIFFFARWKKNCNGIQHTPLENARGAEGRLLCEVSRVEATFSEFSSHNGIGRVLQSLHRLCMCEIDFWCRFEFWFALKMSQLKHRMPARRIFASPQNRGLEKENLFECSWKCLQHSNATVIVRSHRWKKVATR